MHTHTYMSLGLVIFPCDIFLYLQVSYNKVYKFFKWLTGLNAAAFYRLWWVLLSWGGSRLSDAAQHKHQMQQQGVLRTVQSLPLQQVLFLLLCHLLGADTRQRSLALITELHADMMEREETFIQASFLDSPPASHPSQNSLEKSNGVSLPKQGETIFNLHKETWISLIFFSI